MNRRNFFNQSLKGISGVALATSYPNFLFAKKQAAAEQMFIGTPVLPEYLFEKGIESELERMQSLAGINTVMTFSHDHVFRQYRKDFITKETAEGEPLTNIWVRTDSKYYPNKKWTYQDPDTKYAGRDILDELQEAAAPRGMKVYARILEPYVITGAIPGFEEMAEIDAKGEKGNNVCFNHPEYIKYWEAVIEDLVRSHPHLHGFKFGQERGGPLLSSLGKDKIGTCFCEHCLKKAKERQLDPEKARKGFLEIQKYGNAINDGEEMVDGNFVRFLQILFRHPDVLAWEQLWMDSRDMHKKRMFQQIKGINEKVQVGWHIDHGMTWDLITRATWDYDTMGPYSDWLSVAVYFDSMGRRSKGHYERNYQKILFGDADEKYSYPMYLSMLGFDPEMQPSLEEHRAKDTSFSSDYVYQECLRAVKNVKGAAQVYARPGFDMPGYDCDVQPEEVYQAVTKALEAGVDGLWCGREWDELQEKNIVAFDNAVKDWKKKHH